MKLIATIPYEEVDFVWISNHWDIHLSGLCKMGNTLFWFQTQLTDDYENIKCDIFMLSFWEEIRLKVKKFLFEQMVGFHWSYPQRRQGSRFHYRKPVWLYKILFALYYKMKKLMVFVMLMGVLSSCTSYRIRVIQHGSMKYYVPEKRILYTWEELLPFYGNDLTSAKRTIDEDRSRKVNNFTYLKY